MSYPYTNQGVERADSKPGFRTGRILFVDDPTKFTPREFLQFMKEGFVPVRVILSTDSDDSSDTEIQTNSATLRSTPGLPPEILDGACYHFLCWSIMGYPQSDGSILYDYFITDSENTKYAYNSFDLDLVYGLVGAGSC